MAEFDITISGYLVCIEAFVLAALLWIYNKKRSRLLVSFISIFVTIALASWSNALLHGFYTKPTGPHVFLVWLTVMSFGLSGYALILSGLKVLGFHKGERRIKRLLKLLLLGYFVLTLIEERSIIGCFALLFGCLVMLFVLIKYFIKEKSFIVLLGVIGLLLISLACLGWYSNISIGNLKSETLFNLLMLLGLPGLFFASRYILQKTVKNQTS